MKTPHLPAFVFAALAAFSFLLLPVVTFAQQTQPGSLRGRVLNAASGDYVYQALVRVVSTDGQTPLAETLTDDQGYFWFNRVSAGNVSLQASYTGMSPVTKTMTVAPGEDIDVGIIEISGAAAKGKDDDLVHLDKFIVNTAREMSGAAIAVNSQRYADNTKSVVSIDEMGFTGDGSIAGALKFLPGIDLANDDNGFGNNITLSGAPSSSVPVTIGGFDAVTSSELRQQGDASPTANENQRSVNLMQLSINSLSRVEVNRSPTPDSPGSALAGSINLVPKSAFERSKPQYTFELFGTATQEYITLGRRTGPMTSPEHPIKEGVSFSAVVPVTKYFGFSLSLGHSTTPKSFNRNSRLVTANWNVNAGTYNATPNNPDHYMLNQVELWDFQSTYTRDTINLTADFKLSRADTISVSYNQGYNVLVSGQRYIRWTSALDTANSTLTSTQSTATGGTLVNNTIYQDISIKNRQFQAKYRHRGRFWNAELGASYGEAGREALDLDRGHLFAATTILRSTFVKFDNIQPWNVGKITATYNGIPVNPGDMASLFKAGPLTPVTGVTTYLPSVRTKPEWTDDDKIQFNGNLSRNFSIPGAPTTVKVGFDYIKWKREQYYDRNLGTNNNGFAYNGTDVTYADFINHDYRREVAMGAGIPTSIDLHKLAQFYKEHKSMFTPVNTAGGDATSAARNTKFFQEEITSGYLRLDTSLLHNRLLLVYGVRYELTKNNGEGPLVKGTTWFARQAKAESDYDDWFPSVNANYTIFENLIARFSYSKSIGRPDIYNIAPGLTVPANPATANGKITFSNIGLSPWRSDNVSIALELYSKKTNELTLRAYRRWVKDPFALQPLDEKRAAAVAALYPDLNFDDYVDPTVYSAETLPGTIVTSGFELSGRYNLDDFLPRWARGFTVRFNVSRSTFSGGGEAASAFASQAFYLVPWSVGGGIIYNHRYFSISLNGKWNDTQRRELETVSATYEPGTYRYLEASLRMDLDITVKLSKYISLFINGRDINGYTQKILRYSPNTPDVLKGFYKQEFDPIWTMGVRGKF